MKRRHSAVEHWTADTTITWRPRAVPLKGPPGTKPGTDSESIGFSGGSDSPLSPSRLFYPLVASFFFYRDQPLQALSNDFSIHVCKGPRVWPVNFINFYRCPLFYIKATRGDHLKTSPTSLRNSECPRVPERAQNS